MCDDLKAISQINMRHNLIWELMLYEFKVGHNAMEATKKVCCIERKGPINHSTVTRWLKKFCLGCKNLDNQAVLGWPKAIDSKAVP